MSRTITAMFDTRADAEAGKQRLLAANINADNVRVHDSSTAGDASRGYSTHQDVGMWASIKNAFLPDEDRHAYEEGVRRGGFLLTADVDEDEADNAVRALEDANSVDIDERSGQWKSEGWNYPAAGTGTAATGLRSGDYDRDTAPKGTTDNDQRLDVVEEQLVVGKREVDRGGVRVRSYVTEKPVHEQIRLRDENINVERRPVDRDVTDGDDAFRERTIEMTETDEEAVVGKKARVVEEVVVRKSTDERIEDINETVRRNNVDVENIEGSDRSGVNRTTDRAASGGLFNDDRNDHAGTGMGDKVAGLGKEALGNVKQGLGSLTGSESLERSGEAQERAGEQQQGKRPD